MSLDFSDKKFGAATKFQGQAQKCHVIGSILFRALPGSKGHVLVQRPLNNKGRLIIWKDFEVASDKWQKCEVPTGVGLQSPRRRRRWCEKGWNWCQIQKSLGNSSDYVVDQISLDFSSLILVKQLPSMRQNISSNFKRSSLALSKE